MTDTQEKNKGLNMDFLPPMFDEAFNMGIDRCIESLLTLPRLYAYDDEGANPDRVEWLKKKSVIETLTKLKKEIKP